jgi:hypothetical protein
MVLTHTTSHAYNYPFPTVTLAFFLRYLSPSLNPFAAHVLSTDTIESRVDPATGRLHTTRIHLKKSRMPVAVFKLLPASMTGGAAAAVGGATAGERASYVLETSVVDASGGCSGGANSSPPGPTTGVSTTFEFRSRLGERLRGRVASAVSAASASAAAASAPAQPGWLSGWVGNPIQRTIESLASKKTRDGLAKSREGMMVVMERLRSAGGLPGVLEIMRREKQGSFA